MLLYNPKHQGWEACCWGQLSIQGTVSFKWKTDEMCTTSLSAHQKGMQLHMEERLGKLLWLAHVTRCASQL